MNKKNDRNSWSFNLEWIVICLLSVVLTFVLVMQIKSKKQEKVSEAEIDMNTNPLYSCRALKIIKYLIPMDVDGKEDLVRVGRMSDGGYNMVDDFLNVSYAYSIGVGDDYSWDMDIASRGIKVYMFDHTIEMPVLGNPLLKFYGYGIASENIKNRRLLTLENLLKLDDHLNERNMILKMDVEGSEWDIFANISSHVLNKFSQIVVEFHWFDEMIGSSERFDTAMRTLASLNNTHQLVWVHGINVPKSPKIFGFVPLANQIEAAYIQRNKDLKFVPYNNRKKRVDVRNAKYRAEILMWWLEGGKDMGIDELIAAYQGYSEK